MVAFMNEKALAALRSLPDAELRKIAARVRKCAECGKPFFAAREGALHCSPLCRLRRHRDPKRRSVVTRRRYQRQSELANAYWARFGEVGLLFDPKTMRAMRRALKTGIDDPTLAAERQAAERAWAEHKAELAAEHAAPFTPELEKHYTARIKGRDLIEGDCDRPWQNYFGYREAHAKDVELLTERDMQYVGQWTPCALKR
jgi:hypothetical protein